MWFFWIVAREMESLYGSRDFLVFYLCAAIFSTLAWVLIDAAANPDSTVPMVGASGAVMATVTLFTLFYPKREILFFFIPMPMWVLLAIYLVLPLAARFWPDVRRKSPSSPTWPGLALPSCSSNSTCGGRGCSRGVSSGRGSAFSRRFPASKRGRGSPNPSRSPATRGERGQVRARLRHPRRTARRQARRSARQDRPRRPLRPDRGRASCPSRGEPARHASAGATAFERPDLDPADPRRGACRPADDRRVQSLSRTRNRRESARSRPSSLRRARALADPDRLRYWVAEVGDPAASSARPPSPANGATG